MDSDKVRLISNTFISFIGAGILGLPYAFKKSGLLEGTFIMIIVSYLSMQGMLMFLECKQIILDKRKLKCEVEETKVSLLDTSSESIDLQDGEKTSDYVPAAHMTHSDVVGFVFGLTGRRIIDVALISSQVGFCCAYLIFISENLSTYMSSIDKEEWIFFVLPPLFLLTLIPDLSRLAVFSFFAQVSNLLAFAVVFWFDFEHLHLAQAKYRKEFSLQGLPFFFSIAIYCFEGVGMIFSLEQSVSEKLKPKFSSMVIKTLSAVTLLYIAFGAGGYLSFGPRTREIITLNLPHPTSGNLVDFAAIVKICLCVSLFFSYPVMLFPVFSLLKDISGDSCKQQRSQVLLRLVLVTATGVIVLCVPNFANLMAIVGATCCTLLGFIFPALCHLRLKGKDLTRSQKILDFTLLATGTIGALLGSIDAFARFF